MTDLPLELLTKVFKYNNDNYKTLYSCILVNKQWHNINIQILWKNPFYSKGSTKIIINCLLKEDKDFLTRNSIELTFELLDKSPIYDYARFCTRFYFKHYGFLLLTNTYKSDILQNRLVNFILNHSAIIKEFNASDIASYLVNNYHRFGNSFQNLNKLVCCDTVSNEFIDRLASICKCIQSLSIYVRSNNKFQDSLSQLIKAQNQIKQLTISLSANHRSLSDNFKKAILTHSQSIIYYRSNGLNNINHILLPTFTNLKTLSYRNSKTKWMKNISLPNIESVDLLCIHKQLFLSDLSDFININGKTLKYLDVYGYPNDIEFLGKLFQSIAQCCNNLMYLKILYNDKINQELTEVFNNCIKLESIEFRIMGALDGDKILSALNQTLPKKLKSIMFPCHSSTINVNSFSNLVKNWKGPKPFTIKFYDCHKLVD